MKSLSSFLAILLIHSLLVAQKVSVSSDAFFLGVQKPEAVEVPVPKYPSEARGLGGEVSVAVVIDENGKVRVDRATGPRPVCPDVVDPKVLALRRVAAQAALKATFKPAIVDGKPTRSTGWIKYDFTVPPRKEKLSNEKVESFTVAGGRSDNGSDGLLNGQVLSLPRPPYPPAARAVRASGSVLVQVLIDEAGNIYSAEAVSGHPLLRGAARRRLLC